LIAGMLCDNRNPYSSCVAPHFMQTSINRMQRLRGPFYWRAAVKTAPSDPRRQTGLACFGWHIRECE
jgi:hypothetical protein